MRKRISTILSLVLSLSVLAAGCGRPLAGGTQPVDNTKPQELVIATFGGSFVENSRKAAITDFETANNAKVRTELGISTENLAKLRAQKNDPQIDVAYMDWAVALQAKAEGLIDILDENNIPNLKKIYSIGRDSDNTMVALLFAGLGIAYNPKMVNNPPTSWGDLSRPEFKGKISLPDIAGTAGYYTLVAEARMNGGNEKNIDPGFAAVKKIAPTVLTYWSQADQLKSLFEREEIVIAPAFHDRTGVLQQGGLSIAFSFPKEGAVLIRPALTIVKGAKHKALAEKYINHVLDAKVQAAFSTLQFEGPSNKETKLSPDLAEKVPYGEERVMKMLVPDDAYIATQLSIWTERWNREITNK
jgi:putative spermidine/putrescine transport system substrate-binding protein